MLQVQGDLQVNNVNAPNGLVHIVSQGDIFQNSANVTNFGVNGSGWTQNSSPTAGSLINNDVLTLTDGATGEARSAWFNTQVPTGSFQASFTYHQNNGNFGGDGIAFVLQTDSHGTSSLGAAGGGLGYGGAGFTISPSIGYEINIYSGITQGTNLVTNGAVGNYNPTNGLSLITNNPIKVVLTYDAAHSTFTEELTDTVNGQTYSHQYTNFNIASILNSSSAYLGFTGGSGSAMAVQTVSNFSFVSMAADPIVGQSITLTAGRQIGRQNSPVLFQTTSTSAGNINATAQSDINLAAQAGAVNVGTIQNTNGNITLTAINAANQQIGLSGSSIISAQHGSISLSQTAGSFTAPIGSTITAQGTIFIGSSVATTFSLLGNFTAGAATLLGGNGQDNLIVAQDGLNADLKLTGGSNQNSVSIIGGSGVDDFQINNNNIQLNKAHRIQGDGLQTLTITGGSQLNTFEVLNTAAGVVTNLVNGAGVNTYWIGSDGVANNGSLDHVQGAVNISGGGSGNTLNIDDRAAVDSNSKPLSAGYVITPTRVVNDGGSQFAARSTFAGITYPGSIGSLHFFGRRGLRVSSSSSRARPPAMTSNRTPPIRPTAARICSSI